MLMANKANLADGLWSSEIASSAKPHDDVIFVLDGGALLHKLPWSKGTKWNEILSKYTIC